MIVWLLLMHLHGPAAPLFIDAFYAREDCERERARPKYNTHYSFGHCTFMRVQGTSASGENK